MTSSTEVATACVHRLVQRGQSVATAESLTGGLVVAALTSVPGASAVVRGGVCAYDPQVKHSVLGVREASLVSGAVNAQVARELAEGARLVLGADWGVGTTGAAGPDPAPDAPVGTVYVALAGPAGTKHRLLTLSGDREQIRRATVAAVLGLLAQHLAA